jgi:hypothetical protein
MFRIKVLGPVICRSSSATDPVGGRGTLVCNRLCIDPNDGSPAVEYRIENHRVERRALGIIGEKNPTNEEQWQRLTPEQLTSHVMANTVVAHWVSRRLGLHSLIRACNRRSSSPSNGLPTPCGEATL